MSRNVFIYCLINLPFVIKTINTVVVRIRCGSHFRNQMFLQSFTLVPTGYWYVHDALFDGALKQEIGVIWIFEHKAPGPRLASGTPAVESSTPKHPESRQMLKPLTGHSRLRPSKLYCFK